MINALTENILQQIRKKADEKMNILTEEVLKQIRKKVHDKNDVQYRVSQIVLSGLSFISGHIKMHQPILGGSIESTVNQMSTDIRSIYDNEYTVFDILSGRGSVGSYIANHLELFKLCSTVYHSEEPGTITYKKPQPDVEYEYNKLFNLSPVKVLQNNTVIPEWTKLTEVIGAIQKFGYVTKFHQLLPEDSKLCIDAIVTTDSSEMIFYKNGLEGTGIYSSINRRDYNPKPNHRNILILDLNVEGIETVVMIDMSTDYLNSFRLYYHHPGENIWVNSSSNAGPNDRTYLPGTLEAVQLAIDDFVINKLGLDMASMDDELATAKQYLDKNVESELEFKLARLRYSFTRISGTIPDDEHEKPKTITRLYVTNDMSTNGVRNFHDTTYSNTILYEGDGSVKFQHDNHLLIMLYAVREYNRHIAEMELELQAFNEAEAAATDPE